MVMKGGENGRNNRNGSDSLKVKKELKNATSEDKEEEYDDAAGPEKGQET